MAYWLFKTEPETYSYADLEREPDRSTGWDGVRNYQARNYLRDHVKPGDGVLIYHSSTDIPGIAGIAEVTRGGHPDPTAFDANSAYHDAKSTPDAPVWFQVTIRAVRPVDPPLSLGFLKSVAELAGMELLRKGSRLSIQPVSAAEWQIIQKLAKAKKR